MAKPIPKNFPLSQTGPQLFDWICDAEKLGFTYPDDYLVNGLPATTTLDMTQTYFLNVEAQAPATGFIHVVPGGDLVPAIQATDAVTGRLGAGGGLTDNQISALVGEWYASSNFPPSGKLVSDIKKLIADAEVSY